MTPDEVQRTLADSELVPCAELSLADARRMVEGFLDADVPALVHREACGKVGCSPKFQVLVRPEDGPRVAALLQQGWLETVRREGLMPEGVAPRLMPSAPAEASEEEGEPPCPACGTAAALVAGACSDCGLQLE
ncbi:hypothetical protein JYJ95_22385 [Corallococcus exiguus]|uniref:hypothetical protein n=1 Tax=Corallococcus exiguus TaxID=83462 RepID=UPI001A8C658E|nr:hypothetical protein [Corallococcus exiguus]MBN8469258.1 hypothetical protein [Corallococcus exiguus]